MTTRRWRCDSLARTLSLFACAVALCCAAAGCASKMNESVSYAEGSPDAPIILSGRSAQDAAAFHDSQQQLTRVKYGVLEKLGPKPIWEQFGMERPPADLDSNDSMVLLGPGGKDVSSPTTAPATQPTTRPSRAAAAHPSAEVVDLPGERVRIVWVLQNYGGSKVKAAADGNTSRRRVELAPPDLAPFVAALAQHLGDAGTVVPLPFENTLVINCARERRDSALALLEQLDVAPRQVEITAKIFEVSHDFDFQQGAELLLDRVAADDAQQVRSIFNSARFQQPPGDQPTQGSVVSLFKSFEDAGVTVEATFQLLAEAGLIRVVSEPRMTVAVGQTGYMLAGQELPITATHVTGNTVQTSVTYKPVGVQLYITPQAVGPDSVKLHTISVVSSVSGFAPLPALTGKNVALVNPIIDSREAETAVTIPDRHTLVISGLRMLRTTSREDKIPGLGDLPVVGWMFKNHRSQQQLTDLYFFVTPVLL